MRRRRVLGLRLCREGRENDGVGGMCVLIDGDTTMATAFDVGQGGRMGWGIVEGCILEGGQAGRVLWDMDIVSIEGLE